MSIWIRLDYAASLVLLVRNFFKGVCVIVNVNNIRASMCVSKEDNNDEKYNLNPYGVSHNSLQLFYSFNHRF